MIKFMDMAGIRFYTDFRFEYGVLETVSPLLRRIVARNPGPFTGPGTATFIVGRGRVALVDPGPSLSSHVQAILQALRGETIEQLLITHGHPDHWPATAEIQRATGAKTYGFRSGVYDHSLEDGDVVEGKGWRMTAVHTPGHTSDHLCYALEEERTLFSGDHVMGWSTSVIIPPDGDMGDYMQSLEKLLRREDTLYRPTHGPAIPDPQAHVRAFLEHRRERSAAILRTLARGKATIPQLVEAVYDGLSAGLRGAAGLSVEAHLLEMIRQGQVQRDGRASSGTAYRLASD